MQRLNLPAYNFKVRNDGSQKKIYDIIRRKYVALIPEEWVRQNFIHYLLDSLQYPKGLLSVEHPLLINGVNHRADVVVFNSQGVPMVIVECKASTVEIDNKTIQQASRYNILLKAPYLILTNGILHYCVWIDFATGGSRALETIPNFKDLHGDVK